MAALAIPALIALLFKLALLVYALRAPRQNRSTRVFVLFLGLFAAHNIIEIFGFNYFATYGVNATTREGFGYGYAYFTTVILCTAAGLHLCLRISIDRWNSLRLVVPMLYLPVPILVYLLLGTDKLVSGFQSFQNYSILRVPGPLYHFFEIYATLYPLAALVYLIYGARGSRPSTINRIRNRLWLVGLTPLVLLQLYLIVANHFGVARISSTVSVPLAMTFCLAMATYATHQHRLFDIEFYLPWSKVRKRKTEFYKRIQATIAAIAELRSVREITQLIANALRCQVALIGGPQPITALVEGQDKSNQDLLLSTFPRHALKDVDNIVVAQEIADRDPSLYRAMTTYRVGAIVPFRLHGAVANHWLLLGDHFSREVYTPLDFRVVEGLFAAIAERFLDDFLSIRFQLKKAQEKLRRTTQHLGLAWHKEHEAKRELDSMRTQNRGLRDEIARLKQDALCVAHPEPAEPIVDGKLTLEEYMTQCERGVVVSALNRCGADKTEAARLLGLTLHTLEYLMERHKIDESPWTVR